MSPLNANKPATNLRTPRTIPNEYRFDCGPAPDFQ